MNLRYICKIPWTGGGMEMKVWGWGGGDGGGAGGSVLP